MCVYINNLHTLKIKMLTWIMACVGVLSYLSMYHDKLTIAFNISDCILGTNSLSNQPEFRFLLKANFPRLQVLGVTAYNWLQPSVGITFPGSRKYEGLRGTSWINAEFTFRRWWVPSLVYMNFSMNKKKRSYILVYKS